jgi:hypothetical protein
MLGSSTSLADPHLPLAVDLMVGCARENLGHNSPAGPATVIALLIFLSATSVTGLIAYGEREQGIAGKSGRRDDQGPERHHRFSCRRRGESCRSIGVAKLCCTPASIAGSNARTCFETQRSCQQPTRSKGPWRWYSSCPNQS